jgi:CHAD domain-containing protein
MRRLPGEESLRHLRQDAEEMRAEAYGRARAAMLDRRYTDLLLRLELWLGAGEFMARDEKAKKSAGGDPARVAVQRFATKVMEERHAKLRKLGSKHHKLSEARLHELRIQAKKVRYGADFFGDLFAQKPLKRYLKRLTGIQDTLGSLNDAVTGQRLLDQLHNRMVKQSADTVVEAANALGIVLGWQAARIEQDLARFPKCWDRLTTTKRFWCKA